MGSGRVGERGGEGVREPEGGWGGGEGEAEGGEGRANAGEACGVEVAEEEAVDGVVDGSRGGIGEGVLERPWRGVDGARVATLAFVDAYAS